eukprot:6152622-Prymnesium_polylepis.1
MHAPENPKDAHRHLSTRYLRRTLAQRSGRLAVCALHPTPRPAQPDLHCTKPRAPFAATGMPNLRRHLRPSSHVDQLSFEGRRGKAWRQAPSCTRRQKDWPAAASDPARRHVQAA